MKTLKVHTALLLALIVTLAFADGNRHLAKKTKEHMHNRGDRDVRKENEDYEDRYRAGYEIKEGGGRKIPDYDVYESAYTVEYPEKVEESEYQYSTDAKSSDKDKTARHGQQSYGHGQQSYGHGPFKGHGYGYSGFQHYEPYYPSYYPSYYRYDPFYDPFFNNYH